MLIESALLLPWLVYATCETVTIFRFASKSFDVQFVDTIIINHETLVCTLVIPGLSQREEHCNGECEEDEARHGSMVFGLIMS